MQQRREKEEREENLVQKGNLPIKDDYNKMLDHLENCRLKSIQKFVFVISMLYMNFYLFLRYRNALLLSLNAFSNVRIRPLSNMKLKHVSEAKHDNKVATLLVPGKHKTGNKCSLSLSLRLFNELKRFCTRLEQEKKATPETYVSIFLINYEKKRFKNVY